MEFSELKVGSLLRVEDEFAFGFVSDVSRKMKGRIAIISRLYTVMSRYDSRKVELEFLPPTSRHKAYKQSFDVQKIKNSILRGELTHVDGE